MNKQKIIKLSIKYFGFLLIFSSGLNSFSQCSVQATAYPNTICAGNVISLSSIGSCGYLMKNDFNTGVIGVGWSSTAAMPVVRCRPARRRAFPRPFWLASFRRIRRPSRA